MWLLVGVRPPPPAIWRWLSLAVPGGGGAAEKKKKKLEGGAAPKKKVEK